MSAKPEQFTCAVLTMSDKGACGQREDLSGPMLQKLLGSLGYRVVVSGIVADVVEEIRSTLCNWADHKQVDLIVTTGGTGLSPSDVTPEAMREVIDREVPGMAEAMRAASLQKTSRAVLSRGLAGIRGKCLIINLPGSERAARENIEVLLDVLPHALDKMKGGTDDCGG
ncbi:MAG: MogA/MoaB family molybdenum cofactor biosynthesis protein [Desulfobulbaceae bacterium]|uniref:Molybdopterin adenylyltransferase n=1 Tax=Candidatus Desulfatifera sulfidica TaxID=2841691 RepID=A0A8J6N8K4_9BACT|nr:MogA/MoaB family molybdenum cofactor biosynthesis protein [Candidatus Desulfatifera sulfidica]